MYQLGDFIMLDRILGALTGPESSSALLTAALNSFNMSDFDKPEFRSALMAKVALEADGAKIDIDKLRSLLSGTSLLSAYQADLEKELLAWVGKLAKAGGKKAAEGAIEALHLEELALHALFALVQVMLFLIC
jgi:hypothetical protein